MSLRGSTFSVLEKVFRNGMTISLSGMNGSDMKPKARAAELNAEPE